MATRAVAEIREALGVEPELIAGGKGIFDVKVDGVLVYALDGGPLPESQGGPYRLLAPKGSTCANVKGVVRIRVTPPLAG
jgi:DMSO/TMAO reductase YedYZ molybdopterin-dependent catalytic subunit